MLQFVIDNIVAIIFGLATIVLSFLSIRYKQREQRAKVLGLIQFQKIVSVYVSRGALMKGLGEMYDKAEPGDDLWGQCIGCHEYSEDVKEKVLEKASLGVRFRFLVNAYAPSLNEFKNLFSPIRTAQVIEAVDNQIRLHGLSDREVIVSFSTITGMVALHVREKVFVSIIKSYFDDRWRRYVSK